MVCSEAEFLNEFCERGGFTSADEAARFGHAILDALGSQLTEDDVTVLEQRLPEAFTERLLDEALGPRLGEAELLTQVAETVGGSTATNGVQNRVQEFFWLFCDRLGDGLAVRLQQQLPQLSALFTNRPSAA
jgi:hypothetical protein